MLIEFLIMFVGILEVNVKLRKFEDNQFFNKL